MTPVSDSMIAGIGYFHFVTSYGDPIRTLRNALSEQSDIRNRLIVLPEAFNNGRGYYETIGTPPQCEAAGVLNELASLAREFQTVFIAGLLAPPLSSAHLIATNGDHRIVCYKKSQDHSGNYQPAMPGSDPENPIACGDCTVGVLICNEIELYVAPLSRKLGESASERKIIAVPAHMDAQWFGSGPLVYDHWRDRYVVVANSNPYGCGSFAANSKGERFIHHGQDNVIVTKTWAELDGSTAKAP